MELFGGRSEIRANRQKVQTFFCPIHNILAKFMNKKNPKIGIFSPQPSLQLSLGSSHPDFFFFTLNSGRIFFEYAFGYCTHDPIYCCTQKI